MDTAVPIDVEHWPRHEAFEHYFSRVPRSYAITVEVDVTEFVAATRAYRKRAYSAQIWAISDAVQRHDPFRMTSVASGAPAIWERTHPMFTVLNPERETFSAVWAPYSSDFTEFHDRASELIDRASRATQMFPQHDAPPNTFDISSLPWASFTAFALSIPKSTQHLAPIFTLGRYVERDERVLLPLALQVHHAAADGLHSGRLLADISERFAQPDWLHGT